MHCFRHFSHLVNKIRKRFLPWGSLHSSEEIQTIKVVSKLQTVLEGEKRKGKVEQAKGDQECWEQNYYIIVIL